MDFIEPLTYPLKDLKKLVIGGLMVFPGMFLLLIPLIMAYGYIIKAGGDTVRGKNELPVFSNNWKYFLIKGLGGVLISIVYLILEAGVLVVAFLPVIAVSDFGGNYDNTMLIILAIIWIIPALILSIILSMMEMIAYVKYGEEENIGAAFKFKEIFKNFKSNLGNYIIGYLVLLALSVILYIIMVVAAITIIGIIFIGIILFYSILVEMRMFAQIYKESKEKLGMDNKE